MLARVHRASPGNAWGDLYQFPCAGPAGAAFSFGANGPGHASTRAFATRTFVRRALLPRVGPQRDASLRELFEGTNRRSPATRESDWGDLSRCPRARVRGRGTCRVVPARGSDARPLLASCGPARVGPRPSPSHQGTHRGHVVVCRGRVCTRRLFALRARTRAGSQRSHVVAGTHCGDPVLSPARVSVPCACAQPTGGTAAPASVPHSRGIYSPRRPSRPGFTTSPFPSMTHGKDASD